MTEPINNTDGSVNVHSVLRNRLLKQAGLVDLPAPRYKLSDLEKTEWSYEFERLMRNRLIMGALRYGPIGLPGKPKYDRITSMEKRLKRYRETGNMEYLVDVGNLCLLEFVECDHPLKHFHSLDGDSRDGVAKR